MDKLSDMIGSSITDVPCKFCGSINTGQCDTDEIDFECTGKGHYYVDYYCGTCRKHFRVYFDFEYAITKATY